jgi:tRNA (mo5U34)-methyltransferase
MATNSSDAVLAHPGETGASPSSRLSADQLQTRIHSLGEWFHNIDLHGVATAPDHFLGDYPNLKWKQIKNAFPADLAGASVLDIGCNAGFYSIELKKRGAGRVLGLDVDDRYLDQGRFAAEQLGMDIEFRKACVYDVDQVPGQFDYVLFLGVFYHLRYPLLALDKLVKKVGGKLFFQTMLRGSGSAKRWEPDYDFWQQEIFQDGQFPCAYFIEEKYSHDGTNWFIPNASGAEAMLRSSGLEILEHPEAETWVCVPNNVQRGGEYILDLELQGKL